MTASQGMIGGPGAWWSNRAALAGMVGALGVVALVVGLLVTRGDDGPTSSDPDAKVSVAQALATPQRDLPKGMPTAKPEQLGAALDPLSGAEVGYARALALRDIGPGVGERVDGSPGLQFLSINLTESDLSDPVRSATVNSYDYAADELVTQTVNLERGTVETERKRGIQPPPTKREVDTAMTMLLASPKSAALKADYEDYTGLRLTRPDQLDYAGGSWVADDHSAEGAEQCGDHRCVFFQVRTGDGRGLVVTDQIVDLSAGKVETVKP